MRAVLPLLAVLVTPAAGAAPEELALSRTGAAAAECPADTTCAIDLERTVAGQLLTVHHRDQEKGRVVSLRVGAVDLGVGMLGLDTAPRASLHPGTLEDGSAAVAVALAVDGGAIVTACRIGAPACTPPVPVECAASGCSVRLEKGTLRAGRRRFRIARY